MSKTRQQIIRFIAVGLIATVVDASIYAGLLSTVLPDRNDVAKACSFLVGTTVSYLLNKRWTFEATERDPKQTANFIALYGFTWILNVAANRTTLAALLDYELVTAVSLATSISFVVATAASTVVNFFGQKYWVFKSPEG